MVEKKAVKAKTQAATVKYQVIGTEEEEYARIRTFDSKGRKAVFIDGYPSVNPGDTLDLTMTSILIDTELRNLYENVGQVAQLHLFARQSPILNGTQLLHHGGEFENMVPTLQKLITDADIIIVGTGITRRYSVAEERMTQVLNEIGEMGKADIVEWLVENNELPASPLNRDIRRNGWQLIKNANYHMLN